MPYRTYHPVYLDLNGRKVLIVGGGDVAMEKLRVLLNSGGNIVVVSPDAKPEIQQWHEESRLVWLPREFQRSDVDDAFVAIGATDDHDTNRLVFSLAEERGKLGNSVDDPDFCNFIMAAIARRGPMTVAISSAGASPALAQRVRNRVLAEILSDELGELAELLGDWRPAVKKAIPSFRKRQSFWESIIDSHVPEILENHGREAADIEFQHLLDEAASGKPLQEAGKGKVYLVGAGPGDPGLITVKAVEALRRADVVLYDRLVNPCLLDYARSGADRIYAGKDRGKPCTGRQQNINELLVQHAQEGKIVVRLKGGDPFVFGRGGEEAIALAEAGVPFEVVPGVSAAIAGPAAAHIPVTHRAISSAFAVFAGQEAEDSAGDRIPWKAAANIPTAVFLMGVERLPIIVTRLLQEGRSATTPVAVVSNATLPTQQVVVGTLADILEKSRYVAPPAVIIVGDVVNIRAAIDAT